MKHKIEKLAVFLADNNIQKSAFASQLNVKNSQVSYWLKNNYYIVCLDDDQYALMRITRRFHIDVCKRAKLINL